MRKMPFKTFWTKEKKNVMFSTLRKKNCAIYAILKVSSANAFILDSADCRLVKCRSLISSGHDRCLSVCKHQPYTYQEKYFAFANFLTGRNLIS